VFELATPHRRFHRSFLAAADEFARDTEGQPVNIVADWPADDTFRGASYTRQDVENRETFGQMVDLVVGARLPEAPRPKHFVPFTELWMADGDEYLGRISLRHRLNELLYTWGGHIGYAVRPSARRRGCATRAVELMLPVCAELGIDPVLITCDPDNIGSRKAIEANGGVYEDTREGKLRYWVPARLH
jgi:predicted acetyltransferase